MMPLFFFFPGISYEDFVEACEVAAVEEIAKGPKRACKGIFPLNFSK